MKVLVTGGAGFCGSVLVPKLQAKGHDVTVIDNFWFGNHLPKETKVIYADIRSDFFDPRGFEAVIHLANIANDPCGELDSKLTWEVNALATVLIAEKCVKAGVRQFIFGSSASIYGIQDNKPVTEETPLFPVSDYNKTKMVAERILLSYADKMGIQIVRPATVCGYSPRMRLDVVVNMLTMSALRDGVVNLMTPDLYRPHCHIEDAASLYLWMLERPHLTGCYNAGFDNQTIRETACIIADYLGVGVVESKSSMDKRSYCVNSDKLLATGFKPQYGVKDAVMEIVEAYKRGLFKDEDRCTNLVWMRKHGWVSA